MVREGERIRLSRERGNGSILALTDNVSDAKAGGSRGLERAEVMFVGGRKEGRRSTTMVSKDVGSLRLWALEPFDLQNGTSAEVYVNRWRMLHNLGIPTVPWMRVIDDDHVAMPDMLSLGGEFFGKGRDFLVHTARVTGEVTDLEKSLLRISTESILRRSEEVFNLAWDKGIKLGYDDPMDPYVWLDGKFEVFAMDLEDIAAVKPGDIRERLLIEALRKCRGYQAEIRKNIESRL